MRAPRWLRWHVGPIFFAVIVLYLMAATAFEADAAFDGLDDHEILGMLILALIPLIAALVWVRAGATSAARPAHVETPAAGLADAPTAAVILPMRARQRPVGHVYVGSVALPGAPNPPTSLDSRRPKVGEPDTGEVLGFVRGLLAAKEETGSFPPVTERREEAT